MPRAFLSHKTEEKDIARFVQKYLARCLINAWLDTSDMPGGVKLTNSILQGIATSPYFIAFISPHYVRSNWCIRELEEADRHAQNGKATIIPVLLTPYAELALDDIAPDRTIFLESILSRYVGILYNQHEPEQSAHAIAAAIGQHAKIQFDPVVSKIIAGTELQIIQFDITAPGNILSPDILRTFDLNIERDFLACREGEDKPLRAGKPVAFSGQGPNWLYAYLVAPFKNLCPVYVFNNRSNEYICVYDNDITARRVGSVLRES